MPRTRPHVLVVGSSNTDLVIRCDRLPKPGETLLGGAFARFAGGKGANQAVAAARAGARVTFVGAHGRDDFGRAAKAGLRREGIDCRHFVERDGVASGVALILLGGKTRENLIAVARSANDTVRAADVRRAAKGRYDAVVAQLEVPPAAVAEAARLARAQGIPFILNPAPARDLPASLLRQVHTIVPNEHEARLLRRLDLCRHVVITCGARGARVDGRRVPAPRVRPVDTVGAGDCFTAWLAVGIAEGLSLEEAARRAARAASIAVTRPGAQSGMPWRREVP